MKVSAKIDPIEKDITVLFGAEMSPQGRSRMLASHARQALEGAQEQNRRALGRVPPHETFVDGRPGAALESVKPDGRIVFEFELLDDLFSWIADQLRRHSPVGKPNDPRPGHPGMYRESHLFTADGAPVDPRGPVPAAEEYAFVNTVPYARKIERGLSPQAPEGVYEVVAVLASRRFSNLARIRFGFRTPLIGGVNEWANTPGALAMARARGRRRDAAEWLRRQPAIIVTPR